MRRGSVMTLEVLMALGLLVIVIGATLTYIAIKSDGTAFFQEFYSEDLSLINDILVASPYATTITYDNLKRGYGLNFYFEKSKVTVQHADKEQPFDPKLIYETRPYGVFNKLSMSTISFYEPYYLVFLEEGNNLMVKEEMGFLKQCSGKKSIIKDDIKLKFTSLKLDKLLIGVHKSLSLAFGNDAPDLNNQNPNFFIFIIESNNKDITIVSNDNNLISDGEYLSCLIGSQFKTFTNVDVKKLKTNYPDDKVFLEIYLPKEVIDKGYQSIGEIIGRGVAIYAR